MKMSVCDRCGKEHDNMTGVTAEYFDGTTEDLCEECYDKSLDE